MVAAISATPSVNKIGVRRRVAELLRDGIKDAHLIDSMFPSEQPSWQEVGKWLAAALETERTCRLCGKPFGNVMKKEKAYGDL